MRRKVREGEGREKTERRLDGANVGSETRRRRVRRKGKKEERNEHEG